jgi:DNA-directed RNA polymerase subunit E'/Rpb7
MSFTCSVTISPHDFDKRIKSKILQLVKQDYLHKCSEFGYIERISKIEQVSEGKIYDCDLSGNITFDVKVNAKYIQYNPGDIITGKIDTIDTNIGAIILRKLCYCGTTKYIPNDNFVLFIILDDTHAQLKEGDEISVEIITSKVELLDNQIHLIGKYIS